MNQIDNPVTHAHPPPARFRDSKSRKHLNVSVLAALLLTGMVALPVENLWANDGGEVTMIDFGSGNTQIWYIGENGASDKDVIVDVYSGLDGAAGGYSGGTINPGGKAENNVLRIVGNGKLRYADGGSANRDNGETSATNNKLIIKGVAEAGEARGGLAHSKDYPATATGNTLSIEGDGKAGAAYGGHALVTNPGTATATSNALSIKDRGSVMGYAYGGYAEASSCTATGNTLSIEGDGKVGWSTYGGYAGINSGGTATAKNNALSIKDSGSVGEIADPGYGNAYGGYAHVGDGEGTAMGNTLTIEDGGSVRDNAYGGYVNSFGSSSIITVTGNTVFLNGGSFGAGKRVYGGYAKVADTGNVTDNTVVLGASLKANTLATVELYGGGYEKSSSGSGTATVSNNTLKVEASGVTVQSINNFDNYRFATNALSTTTTTLTLRSMSGDLTIDPTRVSFDASSGGLAMNLNDTATLLQSTRAITLSAPAQATIGRLDGQADGLPETAWNLAAPGDNTLKVTFDELYLYGDGGGQTGSGQRPTGNTLDITAGTATAAFGGRATTGDVTGNTVNMSGGALQRSSGNPLSGNLYGGYADKGSAAGNAANVSGGTVEGSVYGGYSVTGAATGNTVTVSGGVVHGDVYGGYSESGGATTGNRVVLAGGSVQGRVYGGNNGAAGNTLSVRGGGMSVGGIENFENYEFTLPPARPGAMLTLTDQGGVLNIDARKVRVGNPAALDGYGLGVGESVNLLVGPLTVTNLPTDPVPGSTVTRLDGAPGGLPVEGFFMSNPTGALGIEKAAFLYGSGGGQEGTGQRPTGNTLVLNGQTATAAFAGRASAGDVTGNTLVVEGPASLIGHSALAGKAYGGYADNGSAHDNTVILAASMTGQTADFKIYGGNTGATGNTLNVYAKNVRVGGLSNFEWWNFILPADTRGGETIITSDAAVDMTAGGTVTPRGGVAVLDMVGGGNLLQANDRITLIHSDAGVISDGYTGQDTEGAIFQGVSVEYTFNMERDAQNLTAVVGPAARARAQSKAVAEGRAAHAAQIAQASDLVAGGGMSAALDAARGERRAANAAGLTSFGAAEAGYTRINTGSHVTLTGGSAVVGVGRRIVGEKLEGLAGAFIELGASHNKTFNDNAGFDQNGKGDATFIGGGLLGRLEGTGGFYGEGSLRLGRMDADWSGNFLWMGEPWHDGYDVESSYYGAHAGLGYIMGLSGGLSLDLYGRVLWSRLEGKDMVLHRMPDPYTLKDVDSLRSRLGFTLTRTLSERFSAYAGGAWEHEFDGEAGALTYQILEVPAASFEGDTGVLDAGIIWQAGAFSTRAGLSGYLGTRRGVSGNVMARYEF